MRIYTCCPEEGCGVHAETLRFLKSWCIEPELGFDEEAGNHYLEFRVPTGTKRRPFINATFRKARGGVLCYCGHWHEPEAKGHLFNVRCKTCRRKFDVCMTCANEGTGGCPWCDQA